MAAPSPVSSSDPSTLLRAALLHCRRGEWHAGLHHLHCLQREDPDALGPLGLSYLGQALARRERRHDEGLALCERALEAGFFQPECWWNLAWCQLLGGRKAEAIAAVHRGLELTPGHPLLQALQRRLGRRQPRALGFLARTHPLNVALGRWRHARRLRREEAS